MENYDLFLGLWHNLLTNDIIQPVEKFIGKAYDVLNNVNTVNEACLVLFPTATKLEALSPTSEALGHRMKRAHYQATMWMSMHVPCPLLPEPIDLGWNLDENGNLLPVLTTENPIPDSCLEFLTCGFGTDCKRNWCSCTKFRQHCTRSCKCMRSRNVIPCSNVKD